LVDRNRDRLDMLEAMARTRGRWRSSASAIQGELSSLSYHFSCSRITK
jgi:hypothetical protein